MEFCLQLNNTTDWSYPDPEADNGSSVRITMSVFLILFVVIATPCNILVIGSIVKQRLFKQPTILLFLNLLVANTLFCIIHLVPFGIVTSVAGEYILGSTDFIRCCACLVDGVILIFLSIGIGWSIVFISVDRFVYLYKPLRYSNIITIKRTVIMIVIAWIYTIAFSIPPLFGFGGFALAGKFLPVCSPYSTDEEGRLNQYWWLLIFAMIIPLLLTVTVMNVWILQIICKNIRRNRCRSKNLSREEASRSYSNTQKQQIWLFQVFGALFIANILIYIPLIAYILAITITKRKSFLELLTFVHIAFNSQTVVHPLLQALFIKDIRALIKRFLLCCSPKKLPSLQHNDYVCCGCLEACNAAVAIQRESDQETQENQGQAVTA